MSLALSLDDQYATSIEKAWSALTDSKKVAKWIMENDFEPVAGHRFQFRNGAVRILGRHHQRGRLVVDEPNRLSYTFASGGETHTVTWTLEDGGDGKVNLHLEQTGFSSVPALEGARYGWGNWFGGFAQALEL